MSGSARCKSKIKVDPGSDRMDDTECMLSEKRVVTTSAAISEATATRPTAMSTATPIAVTSMARVTGRA